MRPPQDTRSGLCVWAAVGVAAALASCGSAPTEGPAPSRLAELHRLIRFAEGYDGPPRDQLTPAERHLLEEAQVPLDGFTGDLVAMAKAMTFANSIREEDHAEVVAEVKACGGAGSPWLLAIAMAHREAWDDAAQLILHGLRTTPPQQRALRTWKWWSRLASHRSDFTARTADLSAALRRCVERGSPAERAILGDVFGRPTVMDADVPALLRMPGGR